MPEIEVKPEHAADPNTRRVGILVGVVGILLSVVTIASHRAHTQAVIHRTESNDQWAFYQAKKIREHTSDVALSLLQGGPAADSEKAIAAGAQARGGARQIRRRCQRHHEGSRGERRQERARRAPGTAFRHRRRVAGTRAGVVLAVLPGAQQLLSRSSAFSPAPPEPRWASWVSCFEHPRCALPAGHRRRFFAGAAGGGRDDDLQRRSPTRPNRRESKRVRPSCWPSERCMAIG